MGLENVKLPDIGEGVTEGELVKWLVKSGDQVLADQPIAEVMTDKATVEVPTPVAGTVKDLKFKEGDTIPIETVILTLEAGSSKPAGASPAPTESIKGPSSAPQPKDQMTKSATAPVSKQALDHVAVSHASSDVSPPPADSRVLATPATRRLARETGVDINGLTRIGPRGSRHPRGRAGRQGRGGWIFARNPPRSAARRRSSTSRGPRCSRAPGTADERVPLRGIRKKIAENMQMAKHVIPHFTLMEEMCVDELVKVRGQAKAAAEKYGVKVTYLPFVIKALIATAREFPMFNASMDDAAAEIVYKKNYNVAFAADTPTGLMVPVIKNADFKTLLQISEEIGQLAKKAQAGKLALEDMKGATITVTNLGSVGGVYATPIINHPEVAIIGMYRIQDKPRWTGTEFVRSQVMNFTVTCDHRLIDGAVAANFMKAFAARIENPAQLMLDMI